MVSFRDIPYKEELTIRVPSELDADIRDLAHRERRSISETASSLLYKGLNKKTPWEAGDRTVAASA